MLSTKTLPLVCLLLLLPLPASAQPGMVGSWFGYGQPDDKSAMYIDRMRPDGYWRGEYRTCVKGKAYDQTQVGRWSLVGDVLSLHIETVDGQSAPYTDTYKMLAQDAKSQKYVSLTRNFPYTPKRVADNFQMPPCDLVS